MNEAGFCGANSSDNVVAIGEDFFDSIIREPWLGGERYLVARVVECWVEEGAI